MPNNVVHTKRDERLWQKAMEIAEEAGKKGVMPYVMGIYKKMKSTHDFKSAASVSRVASMHLAALKKITDKTDITFTGEIHQDKPHQSSTDG